MKPLLLLLLLSGYGSARAATLSGDVTCDGCGPVAVRVVLGASPLGPSLYTVTMDAPGPWSIEVGNGTGLVGVYAFEDIDVDGEPDPGAAVSPYAANPIDVTTNDIAGIHLGVTPAEPPRVTVSGTVTCVGCDVVRVRVSANDTPLIALADVELEASSAATRAWSVAVPRDLGALWVFGAADADDDVWVAFAGNPLAIGEVDVSGIDLTLSAPRADVVLSGTIACPSCAGGVGVEVRAGSALGPIVLVAAQATPGPFALSLPLDLGPVALVSFRDDDGDGVADAGAPTGPYALNPVTIVQDDIGGLTLVVPPPDGTTVQLSGTVACADCVGVGVALRLGGALGPELMATALASGSGVWTLRVPAGLGAVGLLAFRDDDRDGIADVGQPVGVYAQNPLEVGASDVAALTLSVPAKVATAVTVSGTITCADCTGGVGVRVHLGAADGPLFVTATLAGPGPFTITLPLALGEVALVGFRDDDVDGLPDVGASEVAYAANPLTVGASDVSGLMLTLPAGGAGTVPISGRVDCDDCAAGVGVVAVGEDGATLARVHLAEPGTFRLALRRDAGPITVSAYRDDDGDLRPDDGSPLVPYPANPVLVAGTPIADVVIDLTPMTVGDPGPEEAPDAAPEASDDVDATAEVEVDEDVDAAEEVEVSEDIAVGEDVVPEDTVVVEDTVVPEDTDATEDVAPEPDADVTSEPTADLGVEVDEPRTEDSGCGCSAGGGAEAALWTALASLARRRRRMGSQSLGSQ